MVNPKKNLIFFWTGRKTPYILPNNDLTERLKFSARQDRQKRGLCEISPGCCQGVSSGVNWRESGRFRAAKIARFRKDEVFPDIPPLVCGIDGKKGASNAVLSYEFSSEYRPWQSAQPFGWSGHVDGVRQSLPLGGYDRCGRPAGSRSDLSDHAALPDCAAGVAGTGPTRTCRAAAFPPTAVHLWPGRQLCGGLAGAGGRRGAQPPGLSAPDARFGHWAVCHLGGGGYETVADCDASRPQVSAGYKSCVVRALHGLRAQ